MDQTTTGVSKSGEKTTLSLSTPAWRHILELLPCHYLHTPSVHAMCHVYMSLSMVVVNYLVFITILVLKMSACDSCCLVLSIAIEWVVESGENLVKHVFVTSVDYLLQNHFDQSFLMQSTCQHLWAPGLSMGLLHTKDENLGALPAVISVVQCFKNRCHDSFLDIPLVMLDSEPVWHVCCSR